MTPAVSPGIAQAMILFNDPAVREQVLAWHKEGVSLLDMSDRLKIVFEPDLRATIGNLKADEVATIRTAMVAAIEGAGTETQATMPVDCALNVLPPAISVEPETVDGQPWAKVVAAK
jgi:hypothetical protein